MKTISGTFYRSDGEKFLAALMAIDVLNYEAMELGNEDALNAIEALTPDEYLALAAIPAIRLLWVCKNKEQALRYARDENGEQVTDINLVDDYVTPYNVREALVIIPDDGDGGMLILLNQ